MKTILLLAITAFTFIATPSVTRATDCYRPVVSYCKPYVVGTEVVGRCQERRMGYDSCGRCYYYYVTVVTYRTVYSNGASQYYTRTFRA